MLGFGVLVNFFDRVNLSVSQDALHESFGISLIAFGYLSSAFSWTYAAMQVPGGLLLDRLGVKRIGRLSTFLWSIATFAASISSSITGFFAARFLLGIGESPTFPSNAKAIGDWFPEHERSLSMAITDAAAKLSTAIGVPFLGILLLRFGWRWSFAVTGFISLIYFFLFYWIYKSPGEDARLSADELEYIGGNENQSEESKHMSSGLGLSYLLRQPKVYGLSLGWGAYNFSFFLLLTWLPSYLSIALHLDLLHSVLYTSIPWLFATITDFVLGGWLVDFLIQRGCNAQRVRQSVLIIGTGFGLGILGAATAHTVAVAIFWISISLGGLAAAAPVAWTVPSLIAPTNSVGTVASIANLSGQLGAIFAPIITGYIVAWTHSFTSAFAIATIVLFAGIAGYGLLLGRIEMLPDPTMDGQKTM